MFRTTHQSRRPLARTLAIGVPWLAVVGLLAGAEYVRNEGTLTRGLLQFFSGSCPSQLAGLEVPDCSEGEMAEPAFLFEGKQDLFVFTPAQLEQLEKLQHIAPEVPVLAPIPPGRHSTETLIAIEAARAEVQSAVANARSWREAQDLRMTSMHLLRRSDNSPAAAEAPAITVRVHTDG